MGQSLSDFGKAIKLLGACEGDPLGRAFSELGSKSELLSIKLQKEVSHPTRSLCVSSLNLAVVSYYIRPYASGLDAGS